MNQENAHYVTRATIYWITLVKGAQIIAIIVILMDKKFNVYNAIRITILLMVTANSVNKGAIFAIINVKYVLIKTEFVFCIPV